ncbi:MAG: hypothetical protein ACXACP_04110 [Candidatus Hodarchaeales archaeon]|jgi:translin
MKELLQIFSQIQGELEEANALRERILTLSRQSIQKSSISIKYLHRGDYEKAEELISENKDIISEINKLGNQLEPIRFGIILSCNQEFAESVFLQKFLENKPFPGYEALSIPYLAYIHGIADFVGELRRVILDTLRKEGDIEIAVRALDLMDEFYSLLLTIDFPDSLTYNLRKKTDFVRNLTERTRGDVTLALNRLQLVETFKDIVSSNNDRKKE